MSKDRLESLAHRNINDETKFQHLAFRRDVQQKAQRRRAIQSLPQRLAVALAHAEALSDVRAASMDRITHGKPASAPPAPINGLLNGASTESVKDIYERRIRILIEGLEREVDSHRLRNVTGFTGDTEEADDLDFRLLHRYEGESPRMVAFLEVGLANMRKPEKYVMNLREKNGRDPIDGRLITAVQS